MKPKPHETHKYNIESLREQNTKEIIRNGLDKEITKNVLKKDGDIHQQWKTVNKNMLNVDEEAIGKRRVDVNGINNIPWDTPDIKTLQKLKRDEYLEYIKKLIKKTVLLTKI